MAVLRYTWALSDATLSGGARLATAGGGLPQRITTEATRRINNKNNRYNNAGWMSDSQSFWVGNYGAATKLHRLDLDGNELQTIVPAGEVMGTLVDGNSLYACEHSANRISEYNATTGAFVRKVAFNTDLVSVDGTQPSQVVKVPGSSAGVLWWKAFGVTRAQKINLVTPANIANLPAGQETYSIAADSAGLWGIHSDAISVRHYLDSTQANDKTATRTGPYGNPGGWFTGYAHGLGVDSLGRVYEHAVLWGSVDRWASSAAFDQRMLIGAPHLDGGAQHNAIFEGSITFSPDGNYVAFPTNQTDDPGLQGGLQVTRTSTHRARWSRTFQSSVTVVDVAVPTRGSDNAKNATYDLRKTRTYWSTDGGQNRTEFGPGTPLAVSVTAGQTLTVDVDMVVWGAGSDGVAPWVGGDAGEGPTVSYEDPATTGVLTGSVANSGQVVGTVGG